MKHLKGKIEKTGWDFPGKAEIVGKIRCALDDAIEASLSRTLDDYAENMEKEHLSCLRFMVDSLLTEECYFGFSALENERTRDPLSMTCEIAGENGSFARYGFSLREALPIEPRLCSPKDCARVAKALRSLADEIAAIAT